MSLCVPAASVRRFAASLRVAVATTAWLVCAPDCAVALDRPAAEPFLGLPENPALASATPWDVEVAYPNLEFDDPVFVLAEPGANRLWVAEREGRIVSFEDDAAATGLRVVLDLRDATLGDGDSGMLSLAFHPDYGEAGAGGEGRVFVAYARIEPDDETAPLRFRLSRFDVDRGTGVADPSSETILIEQVDQHVWHQGGALFFHPVDGFLYVSVGDEGGGRCIFNNCQRIDNDLFSGVLRLDVDCRPGVSHPPPRQPKTGTTAGYCIPDDNPFVGVPGVLEEFYALGLRSPHRMTHDPVDDLVWIGEVGQTGREEIDVLAPAANFQWNVMEGTIPFVNAPPAPENPIGVWTPPVLDYDRETGGTVIGGYVYRGRALPALEGRYVYGDFLNGRIWALQYARGAGGVTVLSNEEIVRTRFRGRTDGITSFGLDRDGEILVLTLGERARLHRIVPSRPDGGELPATLSQAHLFEDLATLDPVDALVPYDVRVPLWSDGTFKRRWVAVPSGQTIGYSARRPWGFPDGSVFVKHFELATDAAKPDERRRLETRVLVRRAGGGVYGVTYRWRDDGSDADLVLASRTQDLVVRDAGGVQRVQRYLYPGPSDCEACHAGQAGPVLGLRARQFASPTGEGDQLEAFAAAGFFDVGPSGLSREAIPPYAALADVGAPAELRVRSYLDANCAHCHGGQDLDRSLWDARITTPLHHQGIVLGEPLGDYGSEAFRIVAPGDPDHSAMWLRTATTAAGLRMPPLARSERDEEFLGVLAGWIAGLDPADLPMPVCGDVVEPWDEVTAGDALIVLRASVGLVSCRGCVCDVDRNGSVVVTDALRVLREAVGMTNATDCAPCVLP